MTPDQDLKTQNMITEPRDSPENIAPIKHAPTIAVIGLVLAIVPVVGLIISILAWKKIRKNSMPGKWLAVTGTVIGLVFTLLFLFIFWLFIMLGGLHGNQAQKDFDPIAKQISSIGGTKLCDNGDSGYGLDNTVPWYQVYYSMPDVQGLTAKVKDIAASQGYKLGMDNDFINQLKGLPGKDGITEIPYGDEQFNTKSDYLIGKNGSKTLKITVNRATSVALYCGVSDYGKKQPTGENAIINFDLTLPDTSK